MMKCKLMIQALFICMVCIHINAHSLPSYYINVPAVPTKQNKAQERPHLVLYYLPWCPYSVKVLDYLKTIHKTVPMRNLENDPKGKEELKRIGGKMQVPCLVIDNKALYESDRIVEWLSAHKQFLDPVK